MLTVEMDIRIVIRIVAKFCNKKSHRVHWLIKGRH